MDLKGIRQGIKSDIKTYLSMNGCISSELVGNLKRNITINSNKSEKNVELLTNVDEFNKIADKIEEVRAKYSNKDIPSFNDDLSENEDKKLQKDLIDKLFVIWDKLDELLELEV